MVAALLALALALPSGPGTAAAPPEPQWRVHVEAAGTYAVDYGAERDLVDGQAGGSWEWEMNALASGFGVDTDIAAFRMSAHEILQRRPRRTASRSAGRPRAPRWAGCATSGSGSTSTRAGAASRWTTRSAGS